MNIADVANAAGVGRDPTAFGTAEQSNALMDVPNNIVDVDKVITNSEGLAQRKAAGAALLATKRLPPELIDALDISSDERLVASADALSRAFPEAVERAVRARVSGTIPREGAMPGNELLRSALRLK